jgi:hypothetical protein
MTRFGKMMLRAGIAVMALGVAGSAQAALITRTFDLTASDFQLLIGSGFSNAIDPINIKFTVTFDNSVDVTQATTGLTVLNHTLAHPLTYSYISQADIFSIGMLAHGGGCSSFGQGERGCYGINAATSANPIFARALQAITSGSRADVYSARNLGLTFTNGPGGGPNGAVPEPASWALMIAGFGLVGGALRNAKGRRRAKATVATA